MRALRSLAVAVALGGVAGGVVAAPTPGGFPPAGSPSRLAGWWATAGPVAGLYGAIRLVLVAIIAAGSTVMVARAVVAGTRVGTAVGWRLVESVAAGGQRAGLAGVLRVAMGLSAGGAAATGCSVAGHQGVVSGLPSAPSLAPPILVAPILVAPPAWSTSAPFPPRPVPVAVSPHPPESPRAPHPSTWTVKPGDDLWSIATQVVGDAGEVGPYWQELITANRDRLPVPSDPSLIFPGDVIVLPPLNH